MNNEHFHDILMIWLLRRLDLGEAKRAMHRAYGDLLENGELDEMSRDEITMYRYPYTVIATDAGDILSINRFGNMARDSFRTFSFERWGHPYVFSEYDLEEDETELDTILEMCTCFGVEPDTVMELLDYGYSYDEIEELLMYPSMLQEELRTSTEI